LKAAFSGSILTGGKAILQSGSESNQRPHAGDCRGSFDRPADPEHPKPVDTSAQQISKAMLAQAAAQQEQAGFEKLKRELDAYAKTHGFSTQVQDHHRRQGLVVGVLTDKLLFDSGSATLQPPAIRC